MSWKFVPTDDFDLDQLKAWKEFFEQDLEEAKAYLRKVQKLAPKLALKNYKWMLDAGTSDVRESQGNLDKCEQAIKLAEKRAQDSFYEIEDAIEDDDQVPEVKSNFWWR